MSVYIGAGLNRRVGWLSISFERQCVDKVFRIVFNMRPSSLALYRYTPGGK